MAVTSIWPVKGRVDKMLNYVRNPEKTSEESLDGQAALHAIDDVIEYAADDMKTEKRCFVTCINCSEKDAVRQFMETKDYWSRVSGMDKTGGRICFHGYQSFAAGEVTAEIAHEIGVKLATRLWGEQFEVIVATHCNTGHYHNHLVLNSVSLFDGHKYDNRREDYKAMKAASDQLCLEYGLSVIEDPVGRGMNYGEYLAEKNGKPTNRSLIRDDIDRAVKACVTREEFFRYMEELGYEFKLRGDSGALLKYPALRPSGAKGFFRFHKLGAGYALEEVLDRVLSNYRRQVPFPEEEKERFRRYREQTKPKEKAKGLYGLYIRYCYELHIIRKFPASVKRVAFFMREDLTKLDRLDEQTRFLAEKKIETIGDLNEFRTAAKGEMEQLGGQRRALRNELKRAVRAGDQDGMVFLKERIHKISEHMGRLRRELALCEGIEDRSRQIGRAFVQRKRGHCEVGKFGDGVLLLGGHLRLERHRVRVVQCMFPAGREQEKT